MVGEISEPRRNPAADAAAGAAEGTDTQSLPDALLTAGAVATVRRQKSSASSINVRLPESWCEALGVLAAEQGITAVDLVRTCVEVGLGLPDGAMHRACSHHAPAARARYRALATEAARRAAVAEAEAILDARDKRAAKLARAVRAEEAAKRGHRPTPPAIAALHARRDRETAEELLAGAQIAAAQVADARALATQAREDHAARLMRARA